MFLTFLFFSPFINAQNNKLIDKKAYHQFDSKYGLDQNFYQGAKYYKTHQYKYGSPFFNYENLIKNKVNIDQKNTDKLLYNNYLNELLSQSMSSNGVVFPIKGKVLMNNTLYEQVSLLYDIYLDELIIEFANANGAKNQIILNNKNVDAFWIGDAHFIRNENAEIKKNYLQLISNEYVNFYIAYFKDYKYQSTSSMEGFGYTKPILKRFIEVEGTMIPFKNKKTLYNSLPKEVVPLLKSFMADHNIKIKKADQVSLALILNYLSTILPAEND